MEHILQAVEKIMPEIIEIRREIHRHPEIGRKEVRTTALIKEKLMEYGVDEIQSPMPTGAVALIHGTGQGNAGLCAAVRADIDALPVQEETGLPFSSQVPGMMHACGHDMHASMLLGAAKILCENRDKFSGTIKLIFQPSEDTLPGGAKELVEKGVMEDPHVDVIFGLHMVPDESVVGEVEFHKGPLTTSVDLFDITVKGKGGHGSTPHLTRDPILAACQMVTLLQQIQSRYTDPMETVIFPICSFHSGDAPNVIPEEAKFGGVARSYIPEIRKQVTEQVFNIAKGVETISGTKVDINHYEGYPACYNDPELIDEIMKAMAEAIGAEHVSEKKDPYSFSEDFSYYTEMTGTPGVYMMVKAGHEGELVALHNAKCAMKEDAMPYGIAALVTAATAYLNGRE